MLLGQSVSPPVRQFSSPTLQISRETYGDLFSGANSRLHVFTLVGRFGHTNVISIAMARANGRRDRRSPNFFLNLQLFARRATVLPCQRIGIPLTRNLFLKERPPFSTLAYKLTTLQLKIFPFAPFRRMCFYRPMWMGATPWQKEGPSTTIFRARRISAINPLQSVSLRETHRPLPFLDGGVFFKKETSIPLVPELVKRAFYRK